ncbi:hypothetical protein [Methylorubrum thiocyanatum]|uniref:hypothetical protein n=1 Tax=Methylorubrum thiocyanatum TaxID=47958 RepID=UPI003F82134D
MKRSDLVDVAVPMAAFFEQEDEARPEEALKRRQDASRQLLRQGFSPQEVEALYGKVLPEEAGQRQAPRADAEAYAPVPLAAFLRR